HIVSLDDFTRDLGEDIHADVVAVLHIVTGLGFAGVDVVGGILALHVADEVNALIIVDLVELDHLVSTDDSGAVLHQELVLIEDSALVIIADAVDVLDGIPVVDVVDEVGVAVAVGLGLKDHHVSHGVGAGGLGGAGHGVSDHG